MVWSKTIIHLLRRLYVMIRPPRKWQLAVYVIGGIFAGIGLAIIHLSNAFSYLSDKPETCMNCHVMATPYATWERSGHGHVTGCTSCHVPNDAIHRKWLFKAMDGLRHTFMFTFRLEPQVMRMMPAGQRTVQQNCLRCHTNTMARVDWFGEDRQCWQCHREVPHGRVRSLSATHYTRIPKLSPVIPIWLTPILGMHESGSSTKENP